MAEGINTHLWILISRTLGNGPTDSRTPLGNKADNTGAMESLQHFPQINYYNPGGGAEGQAEEVHPLCWERHMFKEKEMKKKTSIP